MELRGYNYKSPQFLAKLRKLLRRDSSFLRFAFQRSVILTRKGEPYRHAITRIDFFRDEDKLPEQSQRNYAQIRFIGEGLTIERLLTRLRKLRDLRFRAGKSSVKFANQLNFQNDYRPRNNEYSDWPGTLFQASLDSSLYLSGETLLDPFYPTYESEYQAINEFLNLGNFSYHDGRIGHLLVFVPNHNGRIERLHLCGNTLKIELTIPRSLDGLILDVEYSTERRIKKLSRNIDSLTQIVEFDFQPTKLSMWLKSSQGFVLDYHTQTPDWYIGVESVLPSNQKNKLDESASEESVLPVALLDMGGLVALGASVPQYGAHQVTDASGEHPGNERAPRAFLSYSWDSPGHKQWVLDLANRLQAEGGVEIILDRWYLLPGKDKTVFMEKGIAESDFVIVVCTPDYAERANRREGGVGYESMVISGEMAENITQDKFIPILRNGHWTSSLPKWIKSRLGVDFRNDPYSEEAYQELLRALHRTPLEPPPIGPKPEWQKSLPQTHQDRWDATARLAKGLVIEGSTPLSVEKRGEIATIMISAFSARFTNNPSLVSYNSGSVSVRATGGETYHIFAHDPQRSGGVVSYQAAATMSQALAGQETVYIGSIHIPE